MDAFFTVDRTRCLYSGAIIELVRHGDIQPMVLQTHVNELYPEGLSVHGDRYLLQSGSRGNIASPAIELLFEYIRRAHYPSSPSRFQCIFSCSSIEDARTFRDQYGESDSPIWEVRTENTYHVGNMRLLDNNQTSLLCSYLGHEYWRGNDGPTELAGLREVVLSLPVVIGERIE